MKIQKYQGGAIIYSPSPRLTAETASTTSTSSSSASKKDKITGTVQKEIMDLLKNDGLPSDVHQLLQVASKYLDKSSRLTDMSLFGGTEQDYNLQDYIKILDLVQQVKFNKEQYDDAAETLTKEDAWGDVATTTNGDIWVQTTKNGAPTLATVSPEEYAANRNNEDFRKTVRVLTNSDLAEYRARNLGFDKHGIIESLAAAKGMKSVTEQLRAIVKDFEANEQQYYKFSHGTDRIQDKTGKTYSMSSVKDGLDALTANGPSGYYKITQKTKYDKDNISAALSYLWNSLGNDAQRALEAKLAVSGNDPNSKKSRDQFLLEVITFGAGNAIQVDFDSTATTYDPNGTGKKGGSGGSGSEAMFAQDYVSRFATLDLPDGGYDTIVPHAAKINDTGAMLVKVKKGGLVRDTNQKGIQNVTIAELINEAEFAQAIDPENVSFGNKALSSTDLKKIAFQGGSVNVAMLPYKTDDATGKIIPDFDLLNGFNQIQDILAKKKITSGFRFAEECKKRGIDPSKLKYDEKTNTCSIKNTMAFAYVVGLAGDQTLDLTDDNKRMLSKIDGSDKNEWADIYNRIVKYNELGVGKTSKKVNTFDSSGKRHMYEGRVYFAMPNAGLGLLMSDNGQFRTKSEFTDVVAKQKLNEYELAKLQQLQEEDPDYEYNRQTLGKWR